MADVRAIKSQAVLAAEQRRILRAAEDAARTEWFLEKVISSTNLTLKNRVRLAVEYLRTRVVFNISRPVTKRPYSRTERVITDTGKVRRRTRHYVEVSDRSKPGEFPKADTTTLMKSIFGDVVDRGNGVIEGYVGTPLDYGVVLELYRDRSFLRRTFDEERFTLIKMLIGNDRGEVIH